MKTLLTIFTIVFTVMFSSNSFAGWTMLIEGRNNGNDYYVDYERIRKVDVYVYYWFLTDYGKRDEYGMFSAKEYHQVDCKLFRFKTLSFVFYKEPMGKVIGDTPPVPKEHQFWKYPPPNNTNELTLKLVCALKK